MPFYEYVCDACQHEFEVFQKISAAPADTCARCQAKAVRRKIFAPPAILKGAGFYETEYGRSKHNNPTAAAKSDAPAPTKSAGEQAQAPKNDAPASAPAAAPAPSPPPTKDKAA